PWPAARRCLRQRALSRRAAVRRRRVAAGVSAASSGDSGAGRSAAESGGGGDTGGERFALIDGAQSQPQPGLAQLLERAVAPLPGRTLVVARDRLRALGAGDLAIDGFLQREHALPRQLAAGARLGDLAPVAVEERQRQIEVERKLADAVVPVVARRHRELRILTRDRL